MPPPGPNKDPSSSRDLSKDLGKAAANAASKEAKEQAAQAAQRDVHDAKADTKRKAGQLFADIFQADKRLQIVGALSSVLPLIDAAVTFDVDGRVVVQGAQLFDALAARKAPVEALVQALLVLEPRASKLGVIVRQPIIVSKLRPEERSLLIQKAPPSRSAFLEEMDRELEKKRTPQIIAEAKAAPKRKQLFLVVAASVAVILIGLVIWSLPSTRLKSVAWVSAPGEVQCTSARTANGYLFCVVDEAALAQQNDDQIRALMKNAQRSAEKAGFKSIAFLRPGTGPDGEQHRFKPLLWERDPVKPGEIFIVKPSSAANPAKPLKPRG